MLASFSARGGQNDKNNQKSQQGQTTSKKKEKKEQKQTDRQQKGYVPPEFFGPTASTDSIIVKYPNTFQIPIGVPVHPMFEYILTNQYVEIDKLLKAKYNVEAKLFEGAYIPYRIALYYKHSPTVKNFQTYIADFFKTNEGAVGDSISKKIKDIDVKEFTNIVVESIDEALEEENGETFNEDPMKKANAILDLTAGNVFDTLKIKLAKKIRNQKGGQDGESGIAPPPAPSSSSVLSPYAEEYNPDAASPPEASSLTLSPDAPEFYPDSTTSFQPTSNYSKWDPRKTYEKGDRVSSMGSDYEYISDTPGNDRVNVYSSYNPRTKVNTPPLWKKVSTSTAAAPAPAPAPSPEPASEPASEPEWTSGVKYKKGDKVTFKGKRWEYISETVGRVNKPGSKNSNEKKTWKIVGLSESSESEKSKKEKPTDLSNSGLAAFLENYSSEGVLEDILHSSADYLEMTEELPKEEVKELPKPQTKKTSNIPPSDEQDGDSWKQVVGEAAASSAVSQKKVPSKTAPAKGYSAFEEATKKTEKEFQSTLGELTTLVEPTTLKSKPEKAPIVTRSEDGGIEMTSIKGGAYDPSIKYITFHPLKRPPTNLKYWVKILPIAINYLTALQFAVGYGNASTVSQLLIYNADFKIVTMNKIPLANIASQRPEERQKNLVVELVRDISTAYDNAYFDWNLKQMKKDYVEEVKVKEDTRNKLREFKEAINYVYSNTFESIKLQKSSAQVLGVTGSEAKEDGRKDGLKGNLNKEKADSPNKEIKEGYNLGYKIGQAEAAGTTDGDAGVTSPRNQFYLDPNTPQEIKDAYMKAFQKIKGAIIYDGFKDGITGKEKNPPGNKFLNFDQKFSELLQLDSIDPVTEDQYSAAYEVGTRLFVRNIQNIINNAEQNGEVDGANGRNMYTTKHIIKEKPLEGGIVMSSVSSTGVPPSFTPGTEQYGKEESFDVDYSQLDLTPKYATDPSITLDTKKVPNTPVVGGNTAYGAYIKSLYEYGYNTAKENKAKRGKGRTKTYKKKRNSKTKTYKKNLSRR